MSLTLSFSVSSSLQLILSFFFFFSSRRRHTRCLSDWSSDVCSSDLPGIHTGCGVLCEVGTNDFELRCDGPPGVPLLCYCSVNGRQLSDFQRRRRSEERRVGKEWRCGWAAYDEEQQEKTQQQEERGRE